MFNLFVLLKQSINPPYRRSISYKSSFLLRNTYDIFLHSRSSPIQFNREKESKQQNTSEVKPSNLGISFPYFLLFTAILVGKGEEPRSSASSTKTSSLLDSSTSPFITSPSSFPSSRMTTKIDSDLSSTLPSESSIPQSTMIEDSDLQFQSPIHQRRLPLPNKLSFEQNITNLIEKESPLLQSELLTAEHELSVLRSRLAVNEGVTAVTGSILESLKEQFEPRRTRDTATSPLDIYKHSLFQQSLAIQTSPMVETLPDIPESVEIHYDAQTPKSPYLVVKAKNSFWIAQPVHHFEAESQLKKFSSPVMKRATVKLPKSFDQQFLTDSDTDDEQIVQKSTSTTLASIRSPSTEEKPLTTENLRRLSNKFTEDLKQDEQHWSTEVLTPSTTTEDSNFPANEKLTSQYSSTETDDNIPVFIATDLSLSLGQPKVHTDISPEDERSIPNIKEHISEIKSIRASSLLPIEDQFEPFDDKIDEIYSLIDYLKNNKLTSTNINQAHQKVKDLRIIMSQLQLNKQDELRIEYELDELEHLFGTVNDNIDNRNQPQEDYSLIELFEQNVNELRRILNQIKSDPSQSDVLRTISSDEPVEAKLMTHPEIDWTPEQMAEYFHRGPDGQLLASQSSHSALIPEEPVITRSVFFEGDQSMLERKSSQTPRPHLIPEDAQISAENFYEGDAHRSLYQKEEETSTTHEQPPLVPESPVVSTDVFYEGDMHRSLFQKEQSREERFSVHEQQPLVPESPVVSTDVFYEGDVHRSLYRKDESREEELLTHEQQPLVPESPLVSSDVFYEGDPQRSMFTERPSAGQIEPASIDNLRDIMSDLMLAASWSKKPKIIDEEAATNDEELIAESFITTEERYPTSNLCEIMHEIEKFPLSSSQAARELEERDTISPFSTESPIIIHRTILTRQETERWPQDEILAREDSITSDVLRTSELEKIATDIGQQNDDWMTSSNQRKEIYGEQYRPERKLSSEILQQSLVDDTAQQEIEDVQEPLESSDESNQYHIERTWSTDKLDESSADLEIEQEVKPEDELLTSAPEQTHQTIITEEIVTQSPRQSEKEDEEESDDQPSEQSVIEKSDKVDQEKYQLQQRQMSDDIPPESSKFEDQEELQQQQISSEPLVIEEEKLTSEQIDVESTQMSEHEDEQLFSPKQTSVDENEPLERRLSSEKVSQKSSSLSEHEDQDDHEPLMQSSYVLEEEKSDQEIIIEDLQPVEEPEQKLTEDDVVLGSPRESEHKVTTRAFQEFEPEDSQHLSTVQHATIESRLETKDEYQQGRKQSSEKLDTVSPQISEDEQETEDKELQYGSEQPFSVDQIMLQSSEISKYERDEDLSSPGDKETVITPRDEVEDNKLEGDDDDFKLNTEQFLIASPVLSKREQQEGQDQAGRLSEISEKLDKDEEDQPELTIETSEKFDEQDQYEMISDTSEKVEEQPEQSEPILYSAEEVREDQDQAETSEKLDEQEEKEYQIETLEKLEEDQREEFATTSQTVEDEDEQYELISTDKVLTTLSHEEIEEETFEHQEEPESPRQISSEKLDTHPSYQSEHHEENLSSKPLSLHFPETTEDDALLVETASEIEEQREDEINVETIEKIEEELDQLDEDRAMSQASNQEEDEVKVSNENLSSTGEVTSDVFPTSQLIEQAQEQDEEIIETTAKTEEKATENVVEQKPSKLKFVVSSAPSSEEEEEEERQTSEQTGEFQTEFPEKEDEQEYQAEKYVEEFEQKYHEQQYHREQHQQNYAPESPVHTEENLVESSHEIDRPLSPTQDFDKLSQEFVHEEKGLEADPSTGEVVLESPHESEHEEEDHPAVESPDHVESTDEHAESRFHVDVEEEDELKLEQKPSTEQILSESPQVSEHEEEQEQFQSEEKRHSTDSITSETLVKEDEDQYESEQKDIDQVDVEPRKDDEQISFEQPLSSGPASSHEFERTPSVEKANIEYPQDEPFHVESAGAFKRDMSDENFVHLETSSYHGRDNDDEEQLALKRSGDWTQSPFQREEIYGDQYRPEKFHHESTEISSELSPEYEKPIPHQSPITSHVQRASIISRTIATYPDEDESEEQEESDFRPTYLDISMPGETRQSTDVDMNLSSPDESLQYDYDPYEKILYEAAVDIVDQILNDALREIVEQETNFALYQTATDMVNDVLDNIYTKYDEEILSSQREEATSADVSISDLTDWSSLVKNVPETIVSEKPTSSGSDQEEEEEEKSKDQYLLSDDEGRLIDQPYLSVADVVASKSTEELGDLVDELHALEQEINKNVNIIRSSSPSESSSVSDRDDIHHYDLHAAQSSTDQAKESINQVDELTTERKEVLESGNIDTLAEDIMRYRRDSQSITPDNRSHRVERRPSSPPTSPLLKQEFVQITCTSMSDVDQVQQQLVNEEEETKILQDMIDNIMQQAQENIQSDVSLVSENEKRMH